MTFHQTIIVGNLGDDPDLRDVNSTKVCNFSVAVNESWTDRQSGQRRDKTTWYRVAAWGRLGEICSQYLSKGRQVMVTGNVEASAYTGNDGSPRATLELRAREVKFLQGGNGNGGGGNYSGGDSYSGGGGSGNNYDNDYSSPPNDVDDIPF